MGKVTYVTCIYCGRRVPRDSAVPVYKTPSWLSALDNTQEITFVGWGAEKVYVCISCAKHRGISFEGWRVKIVREDRKVREQKRKKALGKKKKSANSVKN